MPEVPVETAVQVSMWAAFFTIAGWRIIGQLIAIEGILSVDNAVALSSIAGRLKDPKQQKWAIRIGMAGAMVFRVILLFLVNILMGWWQLRLVGALYLLLISAKELAGRKEQDGSNEGKPASFARVIANLMVMDLAFSLDNVVVAASITDNMALVVTGVVLGMFVMMAVGSVITPIMHKRPWLKSVGYLVILVISIEMILAVMGVKLEHGLEMIGIHVGETAKVIPTIIAIGLGCYHAQSPRFRERVKPFTRWARRGLRIYLMAVDLIVIPLGGLLEWLAVVAQVPKPVRMWMRRGGKTLRISLLWFVIPFVILISGIVAGVRSIFVRRTPPTQTPAAPVTPILPTPEESASPTTPQ